MPESNSRPNVSEGCMVTSELPGRPVFKNLHISPRFSPMFFYCDANPVLLLLIAHLCTAVLKLNRLYTQNPVVETVHGESVKIYWHIYVQRECSAEPSINRLCVESCVTKDFFISPRLSPTVFDPDANTVLLRVHLCTAVNSMHRKPCVQNCS